MIKNWKLFLESIKNDDDLNNSIEELKGFVKVQLKPVLDFEAELREYGTDDEVEDISNIIITSLITAFGLALEDRIEADDMNDELIKIIISCIEKTARESKSLMLVSFENGIDNMVVNFLRQLKEIFETNFKNNKDTEEDWRKEKPIDYSNLTKNELNDLINTAIDDKDWGRVRDLSKYIKESTGDYEVDDAINKIANTLVDMVLIYNRKFA